MSLSKSPPSHRQLLLLITRQTRCTKPLNPPAQLCDAEIPFVESQTREIFCRAPKRPTHSRSSFLAAGFHSLKERRSFWSVPGTFFKMRPYLSRGPIIFNYESGLSKNRPLETFISDFWRNTGLRGYGLPSRIFSVLHEDSRTLF